MAESPDTVHGRLLESVHLSNYSSERACGELEWLLDDDRWKRVGSGYQDINAFLGTIDISEFKIAIDRRKKLAKRLEHLDASQRATARLLGVAEQTVARDLGKSRGAPHGAHTAPNTRENGHSEAATAPHGASVWFQSDADPTREAKRITRNQEREIEREQIRDDRSSPPLPTGRYRLLYVDPPWRYEHVKTESRAIENQYPTMTLDELCSLQVPAAADAVMFMWATSPKIAEAIHLIEAWDFDYRTCAVWDKGKIGMGYYFRQQHELLLVVARGALPVPTPQRRVSSVIRVSRGRHSEKPEQVYRLLERMYPTFTKKHRVELFARKPRPGWSVWSNEPGLIAK